MYGTKCNMPFLGTAGDDENFQYFLLKITPHSALISVLSSFGLPHQHKDTFKINLHAEGFLQLKKNISTPLCGMAHKLPTQENSESLYKIDYQTPIPSWLLFQKNKFHPSSPIEINEKILALIKDSLLIKEGISVYLKHLIPYFSRILMINATDFNDLKRLILHSTQQQIQNNINHFDLIYKTLNKNRDDPSEFYCSLDMDLIRETCRSEIDMVLFQLSLGGIDELMTSLAGRVESYSIDSYYTYLKSIKTLEHRLYNNYNSIVFLYTFYLNQKSS